MDKQMKLIIALLIIILVLGGILGLKLLGIIKPKTSENNLVIYKSKLDEIAANIQSQNTSISINEISSNTSVTNTFNDQYKNTTGSYIESNSNQTRITSKADLNRFIFNNPAAKISFWFVIALLAVGYIIIIGVVKLFRKLSMPEWACYYTIFSPIIFVITFIIFKRIPTFVSIVMSVLTIVVNALFFLSLNINPLWAFTSILTSGLKYLGGIGNIFSLGISIAFLIIWIKAIINLGDMFDKGEGFKIGLFFLPFIFFPILGFQKN